MLSFSAAALNTLDIKLYVYRYVTLRLRPLITKYIYFKC